MPEGNYIIPMLLAGVLNAATLTFVALAVQRTEVVVVNMFSVGSMALSTLGGVWLFGEPWSVTVALGLLFTVGGLITHSGRRAADATGTGGGAINRHRDGGRRGSDID